MNSALGLVVFRAGRGPREQTHVFSAMALSVAMWSLTNALFRLGLSLEMVTLWAQLSYASALATGAALLHFAWIYPRHMKVSWRTKWTLWLLGLAVAVLSFIPNLMIQGIDLEARRIVTGPGIIALALYMVSTLVLALSLFFRQQSHLRGKARAQARYVLFGSLLTAVFGLTFNLLFPLLGDYRFVWVGPLSSLFFVGFSAYSIVAHRLFDIKVIIRRTLVYSMLLTILAGLFAALEKSLEQLLSPLVGGSNFGTQLIAALLVGFAIDPIKRALHNTVTNLLFPGEKPGDNEE
jgi:hypothetical protein